MNDTKYKFWNPDASGKLVIIDDPMTYDFWINAPQPIVQAEQSPAIDKMALNIACGNLQCRQ